MKTIYLIVHNVRSTFNVGSMLRSADGLGVKEVYLSGYTPHPLKRGDRRLPHLARSIDHRIHKTALGAERSVRWQTVEDISKLIAELKRKNVLVAALEQTPQSSNIAEFRTTQAVAIIVGEEIKGLPIFILKLCDEQLQIPMLGRKESFNVAVAAAIALYKLQHG